VVLLLTSFTFAKGAKPGGNQDPSKETLEKLAEAWSSMDTSKIAPYYSTDAHNAYFDIAPLKYNGWADWAEGVKKLFSDYNSFNVKLSDEPRIHMHGNLAGRLTYGTSMLRGKMEPRKASMGATRPSGRNRAENG
jgi:hypothetical protein